MAGVRFFLVFLTVALVLVDTAIVYLCMDEQKASTDNASLSMFPFFRDA
jgi:hypothetical protein